MTFPLRAGEAAECRVGSDRTESSLVPKVRQKTTVHSARNYNSALRSFPCGKVHLLYSFRIQMVHHKTSVRGQPQTQRYKLHAL